MEWNREKCLELIDEYEKYPILWDPKHGLYYNKAKKNDIWMILDKTMQCSPGETKKKMESMLSSFRREKNKGTKSVGTGKARHEVYLSKWFAFSRMTFLLDRDTPRATIDSVEDQEDHDEESERESEGEEEEGAENTENTVQNETMTENPQTPISGTPSANMVTKRNRKRNQSSHSAEDTKMAEALEILKGASGRNALQADECGIYGQHVANKLRSYSNKKTRDVVQHYINLILFDADMGRYDCTDTIPPNSDVAGFSNSFPNQSTEHTPVPTPSPASQDFSQYPVESQYCENW